MKPIHAKLSFAAEFIAFVVVCLIARLYWREIPGMIKSAKKNLGWTAMDVAAFALVVLFLSHEFGYLVMERRADNVPAEDQALAGHPYEAAPSLFDSPVKRRGPAE